MMNIKTRVKESRLVKSLEFLSGAFIPGALVYQTHQQINRGESTSSEMFVAMSVELVKLGYYAFIYLHLKDPTLIL